MESNITNIDILKSFRICNKCSQCLPIATHFAVRRRVCHECFKEVKRNYYKDNLMKFKTYYQEKKLTGVATSFKVPKK